MFEEGADAKEGQRIKPKHLHRELMQSEIGRETLEIIERQDIDVVLSYQAPEDPEGMIIYGRSYGNTATIYVTRCQSKQRVAQTAIHETTHAAGVRGSQRAEVIAEIRAAKHTGRVSAGDIRRIIERIKRDYPHLPYRILPPGEGSH